MSSIPEGDELERQIKAAMREASDTDPENMAFYRNNYRELQEEHPDEVVAILEGGDEIVGSGSFEDEIEFLEHLEEEYGLEAANSAYIEHVRDPEKEYIL